MSLRLKVSYNDESELKALEMVLHSSIAKVRKQPAKGTFKRAYIELKSHILCADLVTKNGVKPI